MKGIEKGLQKGREEGRTKEKIEIARTMKANNIPLCMIITCTGLTAGEIEAL